MSSKGCRKQHHILSLICMLHLFPLQLLSRSPVYHFCKSITVQPFCISKTNLHKGVLLVFVWFWGFFFLVTLQREEGSILPCLPVTGGGRICVLNCDQRHVWTRTRTPWRRGLCTHTGFMQLYLHRFRTKQLKSCRLQRNIGLHLQMGFRPEQLILLYESGYITCGITASSQC